MRPPGKMDRWSLAAEHHWSDQLQGRALYWNFNAATRLETASLMTLTLAVWSFGPLGQALFGLLVSR